PRAAIMAAKMLLDYKGHPEAANASEQAVRATIDSGTVTSDLGGSSSTAQVGEAVREALMKNAGR
ncbi:MAG: isocitrate/isopropylmalate family dehydrogenase, partial [SAR202 cluster bacterium]|nr:isocitrate/isopropylmalate family dehydrogenase [SAR202 cluster bacterium]